MGFDRVVVHYMNCNSFSQCNIHHGPETTVEPTTVEPDIHSLVSHYHNKIRRIGGHICLPIPTIYRSWAEPVKRDAAERTPVTATAMIAIAKTNLKRLGMDILTTDDPAHLHIANGS